MPVSPSDPTPRPEDSDRKENFWIQASRYSQLASILPAALVVGWLIGAALDRWLHTTWLYLRNPVRHSCRLRRTDSHRYARHEVSARLVGITPPNPRSLT